MYKCPACKQDILRPYHETGKHATTQADVNRQIEYWLRHGKAVIHEAAERGWQQCGDPVKFLAALLDGATVQEADKLARVK